MSPKSSLLERNVVTDQLSFCPTSLSPQSFQQKITDAYKLKSDKAFMVVTSDFNGRVHSFETRYHFMYVRDGFVHVTELVVSVDAGKSYVSMTRKTLVECLRLLKQLPSNAIVNTGTTECFINHERYIIESIKKGR